MNLHDDLARKFTDALADKYADRLFLTASEVAQVTRTSLPSIYEAMRTGAIPSVKFGERLIRVPVGALLALAGFDQKSEGTGSPRTGPQKTPSELIPFHRERNDTHAQSSKPA